MRILFFVFASYYFSCDQVKVRVKSGDDVKGGNTTVAEYFNYGDTGFQTAGIQNDPD